MNASSLWYGMGCGCLVISLQAFAGNNNSHSNSYSNNNCNSNSPGQNSNEPSQSSNAQLSDVQLLDRYTLFGIEGVTGNLIKHNFSDEATHSLGPVHIVGVDGYSHNITGIEGSTHIPGHLNIMAFWHDPADGMTKLIYVNSDTAEATVVGKSVGPGKVTGATIAGLVEETGDLEGRVARIHGGCNINPNNSPTNRFVLEDVLDGRIDRDTLHSGAISYKEGSASSIWVQPKGNGNQNTLSFNGQTFIMKNSHLYLITSDSDSDTGLPYTLRNDHENGNSQSMGHWWLEFDGDATGTIVDLTEGGVFALQTIESDEEAAIQFTIQDGKVIPDGEVAVKISILGASPGRGVYETVQSTFGGTVIDPFGDMNNPANANLNDAENPRHYITSSIQPSDASISIKAVSWLASRRGGFSQHISVDSATNSHNVVVLRNGDSLPNKRPFTNSQQTPDFLRDFVDHDSRSVVLDENQAMFLFELTTNRSTGSASDFDDLAVIVTLARDPADLIEDDDDDNNNGAASRLVKVNRHTGGFDQIMTLDHVYSGLTATSDGIFYAIINDQIFKLDPFEQTETLVTTSPYSEVTTLEPAGAVQFGYSSSARRLFQVDLLTGNQIGTAINLGIQDLQSLVFFKELPIGLEGFD